MLKEVDAEIDNECCEDVGEEEQHQPEVDAARVKGEEPQAVVQPGHVGSCHHNLLAGKYNNSKDKGG